MLSEYMEKTQTGVCEYEYPQLNLFCIISTSMYQINAFDSFPEQCMAVLLSVNRYIMLTRCMRFIGAKFCCPNTYFHVQK